MLCLRSFRLQTFLMGAFGASVLWLLGLILYHNGLEEQRTQQRGRGETLGVQSSHEELLKRKIHHGFKHINEISVEESRKDLKKRNHRKFSDSDYEWKKAINENELPGELPDMNFVHPKGKNNNIDFGAIGLVRTSADQQEKDDGYRLHAFNILISSRLSLHRPVPDTRHKKCRGLMYPHDLSDASIIICFYREAMSTLMRSIYSILDRTPSHLLKEIILVDDTDDAIYHSELKGNVSAISEKLLILKTSRREGLIRARLLGSRKASGQVLIFLDSHIEVNKMWVEPLLARIQERRTNVVTPIIDVISPDTFEYSSSTLVKGGFNWGLHFKWDNIPVHYFANKSNFVKPIKSPTMAGGLFAIDRKWFKELGEYDPGMDVWGGENLEISFRIWMCGGSLEIIPCSRIGHIFRRRRPYGNEGSGQSEGDSLLKNSLRLAHVWMDDYIERFFEIRPEAKNYPYGDISDRLALRKALKCQSFKWYLDNIYPTLLNDSSDTRHGVIGGRKFERWDERSRNYLNQWQIQLDNSSLCVESEEEPSRKGSLLVLSPCAAIPRQIFYQTDKNELILAKLLCLEASNKVPKLGKCHDMGGNQEWRVSRKKKIALYNVATGLCFAGTERRSGAYLDMDLCSTPDLTTWNLVDVNAKL